MLKNIIIHEIQQYLYSLRFQIAMILILVMYTTTSVVYIFENNQVVEDYNKLKSDQEEMIREKAEENATTLAISRSRFYQSPRNNNFIASLEESKMPNNIQYSAYNVFRFDISQGKNNPFILPTGNVNWQYLIILLFSFLAIVFSFDAVSGEKESKTLSLVLSNSVPRSTLLFGKLVGITTVLSVFALVGSLLSAIILMLSPDVAFNLQLVNEILIYLVFVILLITTLSCLGILSSVLFSSSNMSLLFSLSLWLVFMFVIPNTALLLSETIFPVEKHEVTQQKIDDAYWEIEGSYPDGKWSSRSNEPFFPKHEIRAEMRMELMKSEYNFRHARYNALFNQLESTRKLSWISPLAVFNYGTEALLDGGYVRFRKNWDDMLMYQPQFFDFFKEFDANDPDSPHWLNPYEDYSTSRKPLDSQSVPRFKERKTSLGERFNNMATYFMLLIIYSGVLFSIALIRFSKFDAR